MGTTVDVTIPVEIEAARALENPARRVAAGRYLSSLIKGGRGRDLIAEGIAQAKPEARAQDLTDSVDAELEQARRLPAEEQFVADPQADQGEGRRQKAMKRWLARAGTGHADSA